LKELKTIPATAATLPEGDNLANLVRL